MNNTIVILTGGCLSVALGIFLYRCYHIQDDRLMSSIYDHRPGSIALGVCIPLDFPDIKGDGWEYKAVFFERDCSAKCGGTMRQYYHGDYFKFQCDKCGFLYDTGIRIIDNALA